MCLWTDRILRLKFPYSAKGVDSYEKWEGITQTRNDTTFPLHCWGFAQKI